MNLKIWNIRREIGTIKMEITELKCIITKAKISQNVLNNEIEMIESKRIWKLIEINQS